MTDAYAEQKRLMRLGAMASVMVAITLIVAKGYAWWFSGSVSLLGSLADSSLDFLASAVTLFAIIIALRPADAEHRFGHGKAEAIAGLFQTSIIFGSSAFLIYSSIERIRNPVPIEEGMLGVYVSIFAIFLTLGLVTFQKKVISKTKSVAISADRLHYLGDLLLNFAVIAALLLASVGGIHAADGYFGLGIALYIGWNAYQISRTSIDMLMDKEFDSAEREKIFNLVLGSPEVKGIHELKTRRSGLNVFIQFHIELDPDLNLFEAHYIADEVEATVGEEFPNSEIIIHTDPLGLERAQTQDELGRDK